MRYLRTKTQAIGALLLALALVPEESQAFRSPFSLSTYIFAPNSTMIQTPAQVDLSYRDVTITTSDAVELHGWWLTPDNPENTVKGSVLFLHGNGDNISFELENIRWLVEAGYQVLLLDYRGYGLSQGDPAFPGVIEDARAGFQWLARHPETQDKPLYFIGQSLGAVVGGHAIAQTPAMNSAFAGMVLDSGFTSLAGMADKVVPVPVISDFLSLLLSGYGYSLEQNLKEIPETPILLMQSEDDDTVPPEHIQRLYNSRPENTQMWIYTGEHIKGFFVPDNQQQVLAFFASHTKPVLSEQKQLPEE